MFCTPDMNIDQHRQKPFKISGFNTLVLFLAVSLSPYSVEAAEETQLVRSTNELNQQLAAYRTQIEELEFQNGPYHSSLIEPLQSMIALLKEKGDYLQVAEIQSRQLQVMRTDLGFENPNLIPLVRSIIANQKLLGNWEEISDNLEHIRHLQASRESDDPSLLLGAIDDQINWLFSRMAIEDRQDLVRNFFTTRDLYEEMEDLVEDSYGKDSPEAVPWLYKVAYNSFHLVQFLNASKGVGSESIDRLVRREGTMKLEANNRNSFGSTSFYTGSSLIPVVNGDRPVGDAYLRDGYSLVSKIQDILEQGDDLEAKAMAKLYRADFQLLSDRGSAIRGYRDAHDMLIESGVPEEDVRWFFERPMTIPMDSFYLRFADALAQLKNNMAMIELVPDGTIHLGVFTAWREALDSTPMPISEDPFWQLDLPYSYVDLSFSVSSRGRASSVDVLAWGPDEEKARRSPWRSVRDMHFRPAIINDRARRVKDVQIRYRFVEE